MPYEFPIVAHGDRLGRLRCVQCHEASGIETHFAYYMDNSAVLGERCDVCNVEIPYSNRARDCVVWVP